MATITGALKDFGMESLAPFLPEIIFTPSGPAVSGSTLFSAKPITVVPLLGGTFTVDLQPTDDLHPAAWYNIRLEWRNADSGYVGMDFPEWKLFVPSAGGHLGDLISAPANPAMVWVGLTAPANPSPGTWWLVDDPDNPGTGSGDLYEWSN